MYSYLAAEDIPSAFGAAVQNCRFRPGSVQTRSGLIAQIGAPPSGADHYTAIEEFTDNQDNHYLFLLDSNGALYEYDLATSTLTQVSSKVCQPGAGMKTLQANNRLYMAFYGYIPGGGPVASGPMRQWNQGILEPFSNSGPGGRDHQFSTGTLASGSKTITNVTQILTWAIGDSIQDSAGAIPSGATVTAVDTSLLTLTISAAPTASVATVYLTCYTPRAAGSGTGVIVPGIHGLAVSFVTRSDYVTKPTPMVFWTAPGIAAPSAPTLGSTAGGGFGATTYYVQITYVGGGGESLPSAEGAQAVSANYLLTVNSPAADPSGAATGYNVYVSDLSGNETLQNSSPIPIGTNWTEPTYGLILGAVPPTESTAGTSQVQVSDIPTGPPNVVARRVYFTPVDSTDLYFAPAFQINDNSTVQATFDFADQDLLTSDIVTSLYNNQILPDCGAIGSYNARAALWAADNNLPIMNLDFDGGSDPISGHAQPLGWIPGPSATGGDLYSTGAFYGTAWRITGDGATAIRGQIYNSDVQLSLLPSTAYTVKAWVKQAYALSAGTLHVDLQSASLGKSTAGLQVAAAQAGTDWAYFEAELSSATDFSSVPSDLYLRVYADGTPNLNGQFLIDHLEIVPEALPYATGEIIFSNSYDAETFDDTNGTVIVNKDDGQKLCAGQQLRSYFYAFKERSMWVLYDDGTNPPSLWSVYLVDDAVGAGGPKCVIEKEEMILIASRPGAYIFLGGRPTKLCQEIQTTWKTINWQAAPLIHVSIDAEARLMRIFAPSGSSTSPNMGLALDYVEGLGVETEPGGRKWSSDVYPSSIWDHIAGSDPNNQLKIWMAGPKGYYVGGTDDDGTAIDCFYQTAFARATPTGQSLFGGASMTLGGGGSLKASLIGLGGSPVDVLFEATLKNPMTKDLELYGNMESERASLKIETAGFGAWFSARRLAVFAKPWAPMRPH